MHVIITIKQTTLSDNDYQFIKRQVAKLEQYVPWNGKDYPKLNVSLMMHKKRVPDTKGRPLYGHKIIDNPVYYDGKMELHIPKRPLITAMSGKTSFFALKDGFDKLFRELDKYKGLHFRNDSEFPRHKSMRHKQTGGEEYEKSTEE